MEGNDYLTVVLYIPWLDSVRINSDIWTRSELKHGIRTVCERMGLVQFKINEFLEERKVASVVFPPKPPTTGANSS